MQFYAPILTENIMKIFAFLMMGDDYFQFIFVEMNGIFNDFIKKKY